MGFGDDIYFRKKLEQSDNVYSEVVRVMRSAREIATLCDGKILHSEAITHVVNGTEPAHVFVSDFRDEYEAYHIRELFCYIDDKEVCDAVYDSFYVSKKKRNLTYIYNHIKDDSRKTRVRVLTRILWFKLIK